MHVRAGGRVVERQRTQPAQRKCNSLLWAPFLRHLSSYLRRVLLLQLVLFYFLSRSRCYFSFFTRAGRRGDKWLPASQSQRENVQMMECLRHRRHRQGFNKNDTPLNILSVASQIDRRLSNFLWDRDNKFWFFALKF